MVRAIEAEGEWVIATHSHTHTHTCTPTLVHPYTSSHSPALLHNLTHTLSLTHAQRMGVCAYVRQMAANGRRVVPHNFLRNKGARYIEKGLGRWNQEEEKVVLNFLMALFSWVCSLIAAPNWNNSSSPLSLRRLLPISSESWFKPVSQHHFLHGNSINWAIEMVHCCTTSCHEFN